MIGWPALFRSARSRDERTRRIGALRWVVLDVETSGLDPASDALIAFGAVAVRGGRIDVDDSFERVLRQPAASDRANILVHGIGADAQRDGSEPADACRAFVDWAGDAPRVAFHAGFDRGFVERAVRRHLGRVPKARWLDLADLAPALNPQVRAHALDEWLAHFDLSVERRHDASADAFATAMLFLRLLAQVPAADRDFAGLHGLAASRRWAGG